MFSQICCAFLLLLASTAGLASAYLETSIRLEYRAADRFQEMCHPKHVCDPMGFGLVDYVLVTPGTGGVQRDMVELYASYDDCLDRRNILAVVPPRVVTNVKFQNKPIFVGALRIRT